MGYPRFGLSCLKNGCDGSVLWSVCYNKIVRIFSASFHLGTVAATVGERFVEYW